MAFEEENLDSGFLTSGSNSQRTGRPGKRYHPVFGHTGRGRVIRSVAHFYAQWELSLAGHWPLDEASGTRYDVLGASPLSDTGGVSWEPGKIGNAATFDSSLVQYLSCPSNINLQLAGTPFTIAFWVKFDAVTGNRPLVWKFDEATGQREYALGYESGYMKFRVYPDGTLGSVQSVTTTAALSASTWYFVVAGLSNSNYLYIRIYQPGYTDLAGGGAASSLVMGGNVYAGTAPLVIGYASAPGFIFDGSMDSLSIWKRSLSVDEEMALFNQGNGFEPPLPQLPRRKPSRFAQGWRNPWRSSTGRTRRAPVPNQNNTDYPYPARHRVCAGWRETWRAWSGRVRRGRLPNNYIVEYTYLVDEFGTYIVDHAGNFIIVSTGSAGIESIPVARSRVARPPVQPTPRQRARTHVSRAPTPHNEFKIHATRVMQGWRGDLPPRRGQAVRHRLPMLRGLERIPHRVLRGWTAGRLPVPFSGRVRRGEVRGSGRVAIPIQRGRVVRPPGRPVPLPANAYRGKPPAEVSREPRYLVDENGNYIVDGNGNYIVDAGNLGLTAAAIVARHRTISSVRPPPRPGRVVRLPVPPSGLVNKQLVRGHTIARAGSVRPWAGLTSRQPVPNQGMVANPVATARTASAPRPSLPRLQGHVRRAGRRMPFLSNSGRVIAGPYYVTAGQMYVAGAVAGAVVVE